jgi:hypothetical protein
VKDFLPREAFYVNALLRSEKGLLIQSRVIPFAWKTAPVNEAGAASAGTGSRRLYCACVRLSEKSACEGKDAKTV